MRTMDCLWMVNELLIRSHVMEQLPVAVQMASLMSDPFGSLPEDRKPVEYVLHCGRNPENLKITFTYPDGTFQDFRLVATEA